MPELIPKSVFMSSDFHFCPDQVDSDLVLCYFCPLRAPLSRVFLLTVAEPGARYVPVADPLAGLGIPRSPIHNPPIHIAISLQKESSLALQQNSEMS